MLSPRSARRLSGVSVSSSCASHQISTSAGVAPAAVTSAIAPEAVQALSSILQNKALLEQLGVNKDTGAVSTSSAGAAAGKAAEQKPAEKRRGTRRRKGSKSEDLTVDETDSVSREEEQEAKQQRLAADLKLMQEKLEQKNKELGRANKIRERMRRENFALKEAATGRAGKRSIASSAAQSLAEMPPSLMAAELV